MWKQRPLTMMGKKLLINSLLNSSFLFNAQIENPPPDFIKLVDKQNKQFLWGGAAKIAHNTLIADYNQGGIRYIQSINMKFLIKLSSQLPNRFTSVYNSVLIIYLKFQIRTTMTTNSSISTIFLERN